MSTTYVFLKDIDTSHLPTDHREAWMPKGDRPYFDRMMRMRFESRRHKRRVLRAFGMREAGQLIDPDKPIEGRAFHRRSPQQEASRRWVESQGGAQGLLKQMREGRLRSDV